MINEISFILYDSIKPDLDESRLHKVGILLSMSDSNRLLAFYKYFQFNIDEKNNRNFETTANVVQKFQEFDSYIDLRFFVYFLN